MTERKRIFRGDRLRQMRTKRRLTQEELAERLNIGQNQIYRYEKGETEPTPDILARIAIALEVTADWLLGLVETPNEHLAEEDLSPDERKLLDAYRSGDLQRMLKLLTENAKPQK